MYSHRCSGMREVSCPSDRIRRLAMSPAQKPDIVVLGGINMALIGTAPRLPEPGETVLGDEFYLAPGGKGGNQAVAAARMGASAKMIGRVGGDMFGPGLLDDLRGYGVDVSGVAEDTGAASGIAVILLDASRQNHIVAIYGANRRCDDEQVVAAESALKGADALMLQLEIPAATSLKAARIAREMGVRVVWDPAPAVGFPPEAYEVVDVLTPNQTEAAALTGVDVRDVESAESAARVLVGRGVVGAVVVKLGEDGAYYLSNGDAGHVPSHEVEATDTVAAGDAFGAAMTCALADGASMGEAVRYGTAAGALAVTKPGAQEAMPSRAEVEALLGAG